MFRTTTKTLFKVAGIAAAFGAAVPPLWLTFAYAWQAAGLPWEAPMDVTFTLMWLWPSIADFAQDSAAAPNEPLVFWVTLAVSMLDNALYYGIVGFLGASLWLLCRKVLRWRRGD